MIRIGIIGTENSHAMAFSRIFNKPDESGRFVFPDCRVVGVYGPDPESTAQIMNEVGVDFIAQDTDEFIGKVDAVMITCRKGSLHHDHAVKFIGQGLPLFVDKPITSDPAQALDLIARAKAKGVPLVGGSSCKYSASLPPIKEKIAALRAAGKLSTATIHYAAERDSIYDGFYFYASHTVEILFELFGHEVRSVRACENAKGVTVVARYDGCDVTLQFMAGCYAPGILVVSPEDSFYEPISNDGIFEAEAGHFVEMVRTGRVPQTPEELIRPVFVISAIVDALDHHKEEVKLSIQ